mgnify:CR=1 FL=1
MNTEKTAIQVIAGASHCPEYSPSMVKALMKRLEINEKAFALLMNVTPATVRLWVTGAARPCSMARMQIYDSGPEIVNKIANANEILEERRPKADGIKQPANSRK